MDRSATQSDDRFAHHEKLAPVALADVEFLKVRDRQYGASWKLSGGRSAWFMAVRKIDRLREMMRRPSDWPTGLTDAQLDRSLASLGQNDLARKVAMAVLRSEDIFGQIAHDPSGSDGTVLAEVRDLRRYLLLIEAEMVARGIVEVPTAAAPAVTLDGRTLVKSDGEPLTAGDACWDEKITYVSAPPSVPVEDSNRHAERTQPVPLFWSHKYVVTFFNPGERDFFLVAGQLYRLPEFAASHDAIPAALRGYYWRRACPPGWSGHWTIDRRRLSDEDLAQLPRYAVELNSKEHSDLPVERQELYEWNEGAQKFLMPEWMRPRWGQPPG